MAEPPHSLFPRSPNPSTRSYDSSSVSSATSPRPPSRYLGGMLNTTSRPNQNPQSLAMPSLPPVNQGFPPYGPVAPTSVIGRDLMASTESLASTQGHAGAQLSGNSGGQGQKRAYRQRRKDPSCDACRERKVKCDATETTSCSECSSRNVKCQFTKETNRRMSSIKQVQDLEKQIEKVKRDNSNLRRMLQERHGSVDVDMEQTESPSFQPPPPIDTDARPNKRLRMSPDLTRAATNLRSFSKGIWKPPAGHRPPVRRFFDPQMPELPPRTLADQLLNSYYASAHTMFPIIHLPTFKAAVDEIYRTSSSRASTSFLSVFFAVLATGSLFLPETPSQHTFYRPADFLELAWQMRDPWSCSHSLDDVRALILITICLNEMNLKSAAWNFLGSAVRVGQDLGLYAEPENWPFIDGEMRRRAWWAIYIMDRVMATEMGHPCLIDDADCNVAVPAAVDDHHIFDDGMRVPVGAEPLTHSMLAVIHVVRSYGAVIKALQASVIPPPEVANFDTHLKKCLNTFPPACDLSSTVALAPHFLAPLTYLFHARLLLHRHNLSPHADFETRSLAVKNCMQIAIETVSLISRTSSPADGATALLTMHIFRCALFLLLTGYFDQAITCVRALAAIDARRDVVIGCGRYLGFFVNTLSAKRAEYSNQIAQTASPAAYGTPRSPVDQSTLLMSLTRDEELLAYVCADVHASSGKSWVWEASFEGEAGLFKQQEASAAQQLVPRENTLFSSEMRTGLNEEERRDWGSWPRLESVIRGLGTAAPSTWTPLPPPPPTPLTAVKSESPALGPVPIQRATEGPRYSSDGPKYTENRATASPAGRERLSIANII